MEKCTVVVEADEETLVKSMVTIKVGRDLLDATAGRKVNREYGEGHEASSISSSVF